MGSVQIRPRLRLIKRRNSPREVARDIYKKKLHFYHSELENKEVKPKSTKGSQKLKVKSDEGHINFIQVTKEPISEVKEEPVLT